MTAEICGSRFGRGLVRPGGVGFDLLPGAGRDPEVPDRRARRDVTEAVELLWETPSVRERFDRTGTVRAGGRRGRGPRRARRARVRDPAGRAARLSLGHLPFRPSARDDGPSRRRQLPRLRSLARDPAVDLVHPRPARPASGGRARRRGRSPEAGLARRVAHGGLARGDLPRRDDRRGRPLLPLQDHRSVLPQLVRSRPRAPRNGQISDFPLCNKSFNLSYCGHDL